MDKVDKLRIATLYDFEKNSDFEQADNRYILNNHKYIDSLESLAFNIMPGEIVIIAGRPGMGKTTFLYSLMLKYINIVDGKVLLLSVKNNPLYNLVKLTSLINNNEKVNYFSYGKINKDHILLNNYQMHDPYKAKIFAQKVVESEKIKAIFVDDIFWLSWINEIYEDLDSFEDYSRKSSPNHGIRMFFSYLSYLASNYKIPIIITEELARRLEYTALRIPYIYDLRSELLELISDKVFLLYRPEYYGYSADEQGNSTENLMHVDIAKNKNGESGNRIRITLNTDTGLYNL